MAGLKRKTGLKKSLPKPKKPLKKSVSHLKKLADSSFSQYIRLRDSDKYGIAECITCGTRQHWKQMQNGHFVSRRVNSLRYDELNCNAQCVGCNMFKAGDLYTYGINLDLKYGEGTAKALHARRFETHKLTREELEKIISDCKEYIKRCEKL